MAVSELLPQLKALDRSDKLRAMQYLVAELAREEGVELYDVTKLMEVGATYSVWSPTEAFDAAETLLGSLEANGSDDNG